MRLRSFAEKPGQQISGRMRGFQLWINLPAAKKMTAPAYQDIRTAQIPEVADEHSRVRVLAGSYSGRTGPVSDPDTRVEYLDVSLIPDQAFSHTLPAEHTVFIFVFEGEVAIGDTPVTRHQLAFMGPGDRLAVQAGADGARFLLVSGRPIGEPIVQYGPFVMNTRHEIEQAMADYRDGRLVRNAGQERVGLGQS